MNKMDINSLSSLRGQRKSISNNKYAEKLGKLREGGIELNPGAAQAYKHLYGNQESQPVQASAQNQGVDYSLLRSQQPSQPATASNSSVLPSPKLGVSVKFKPIGKLYVQKDQDGCSYSYDSFELDKIVFAKTDKVPEKLKKGIAAKGYFTISDVNIDLTDAHQAFEEGKEVTCTVKSIESFFQRSSSDNIAQGFQVEAEINTNLVSIPAQFEIKARPVVAELMEWIKAEIVASNQINEIIAMIPEGEVEAGGFVEETKLVEQFGPKVGEKEKEVDASQTVSKEQEVETGTTAEVQQLVAQAPLEDLEKETDDIFSKVFSENMSEDDSLKLYDDIWDALENRAETRN